MVSLDKNEAYTKDTLKREVTTLAQEEKGRGSVDPIMYRKIVAKTHGEHELTKGQYASVKQILTSPNRFIGVHGSAGTGKTFMLASAARQAEAAGYEILGMAPTSNATFTLGKDAGIKTQTLQKYLMEPSGSKKTILFVDEASMISTRQMLDLLTLSNQRSLAKVVFIGDPKQLDSVAAGTPFKALLSSGMRYTLMDEIKRQTQERHLDAVMSASNGDIQKAFKSSEMMCAKCRLIIFQVKQQKHGWLAIVTAAP